MAKTIMFVPGDIGGCGYYRNFQIMNNSILTNNKNIRPMFYGISKLQNEGQDITFTQRVVSEEGFERMKEYKKQFGKEHKLIIDYDDLVWYNGKLHNYNVFLNKYDMKKNYESMKKNLSTVADLVTVSCEELKKNISEFYDENKIVVIPNMLSMNDWLFDRTTYIPNDDIFFYAGSISHYNNEKKQYGDFSIPFANYIAKQKTLFMGDTPPWFMTPLQSYKWVDLSKYAKALYQNTRYAKFTIAPLTENYFNKCKSDLKYLESCAIGRVCLVFDFPGSPYTNAHKLQKIPVNASIKDIEQIVKQCKENYAEILDYQYEYLNKRWLDFNMYQYDAVFNLV